MAIYTAKHAEYHKGPIKNGNRAVARGAELTAAADWYREMLAGLRFVPSRPGRCRQGPAIGECYWMARRNFSSAMFRPHTMAATLRPR
jgi:hypothetical protein